jgi:hypothetical protein
MYKKDFWEYVKILLRTKSSYRILLDELDKTHDIGEMTTRQRQKLKDQLLECDKDVDRLIEELKKKGELRF